MKAVMWTDTLQVIIMYGAMIAVGIKNFCGVFLTKYKSCTRFVSTKLHEFMQVIAKGHFDVGGLSAVWNANQVTGRVEFDE